MRIASNPKRGYYPDVIRSFVTRGCTQDSSERVCLYVYPDVLGKTCYRAIVKLKMEVKTREN
jgi:hypothetical protein